MLTTTSLESTPKISHQSEIKTVPESKQHLPITEKPSWTEKGKQWLGKLHRLLNRNQPREAIKEISTPPVKNEMLSVTPPLTTKKAVETKTKSTQEEEKYPLGTEKFNIIYKDGSEGYTFTFKKQDIETPNPELKNELEVAKNSDEMIEGCLDRDGKMWWKTNNKWMPKNLWSSLTGRPITALFQYIPDGDTLNIQSGDESAINGVVSYFDRSGLKDHNLKLHGLDNTAVINIGHFKYYGKRDKWVQTDKEFVKDKNIPKKDGYEHVHPENVSNRIKKIYEKARNNGKYLVIRTVGIPVEPDNLCSSSLFAPNHTELFDARVGDFDKGGLIYEIDESAAKLSFSKDAATYIYPKDQAPAPYDYQTEVKIDNRVIYYNKTFQPDTIERLHDKAIKPSSEGHNYYSEVLIDPNDPNCNLVAVVNPYDVHGWSKIAYKHGVPEFLEIPEFDQSKKKNNSKLSNI